MPAQPGHVKGPPETSAQLAERLNRTIEAAIRHGSLLARQLADDGELFHAGLVAGAVACLNGVNHAVQVATQPLTGKQPREVYNGVREDKEQDPQIQGQMQFMQ